MAVGLRLVLACWLTCACVTALNGNSINCSMKAFVEPRKGKRLPVSIIANVTAETVQMCASICFRRSACRSFNYHISVAHASKHRCQLNEFDHENNAIADPNYVYSSIRDWNPMMVYSCANHSCPEDFICLQTLTRNYTCLQLYVQCGSPRSVQNTDEIQWPYPRTYKSVINYRCKTGYKHMGGNPKSVCQLNTIWSEPSITCSKVICGIPPNTSNADLKNHTGIDYGSTGYYACVAGYNSTPVIGETRCTANGTWTLPNINCTLTEINCGIPQNSSTANIIYVNGSSVGAIAEYSCIPNTILKSQKNISECTSAGVWSPALVECGRCDDNKNFTYHGRRVCYNRMSFGQSYRAKPTGLLIASEQSVRSLFHKETTSHNFEVYAGFEVNATHVTFANDTTISRSTQPPFDLGQCTRGICIYNSTGALTDMNSITEAIFYFYYTPK